MGWWNYKNIGATASSENRNYIRDIFRYMGYSSKYDEAVEDDRGCFDEPDVYFCMETVEPYIRSMIKVVEELEEYGVRDLLNLLVALFPETCLYIHSASGSNTSDGNESHDEVYCPRDMTCYNWYTCIDWGGGRELHKAWKKRFSLAAPKIEFVNALIAISDADANFSLSRMLIQLTERIQKKEIVYVKDPSDKRVTNKKYDIIVGGRASEYAQQWMKDIKVKMGYSAGISSRSSAGLPGIVGQSEFDAYYSKMKKAVDDGKSLDEMIEDSRKAINNRADANIAAFEKAVRLIERNAYICFYGKHFVLTGFGLCEDDTIAKIEALGGKVHSSMVKSADYLVACLDGPGAYKLNKALEWRQKGVNNHIISDYQLWQAILSNEPDAASIATNQASPQQKQPSPETQADIEPKECEPASAAEPKTQDDYRVKNKREWLEKTAIIWKRIRSWSSRTRYFC